MSAKQGLEIGNYLMNLGFQYAGAMDDQEDRELKQKKADREETLFQWKVDDRQINDDAKVFAKAIVENEGFQLSDEDLKDPKKQQAYWLGSVFATDYKMKQADGAKARMELHRTRAMDSLQHSADIYAKFNSAQTPEEQRAAYFEFMNGPQGPFTGRTLTPDPTRGKIDVTTWDGKQKVMDDIDVLTMDDHMQQYLNNKKAALMNQFAGGMSRSEHNTRALTHPKWYQHKDTGAIIKGLGFGEGQKMFDPGNGKRLEPFYTDSPRADLNVTPLKDVNIADYVEIPKPAKTTREKELEGLEIEAKELTNAEKRAGINEKNEKANLTKTQQEILNKTGGKSKTSTAEVKDARQVAIDNLAADITEQFSIPVSYDEYTKSWMGTVPPEKQDQIKQYAAEKYNLRIAIGPDGDIQNIMPLQGLEETEPEPAVPMGTPGSGPGWRDKPALPDPLGIRR